VEENLKHLMQKLGHAINESLSESESIEEVLGEIQREGYDVFLVLEATIGFNERVARESDPASATHESFSDQDHAFLKALKITVKE
jgi:hypothetical protein